MFFFRVLCGQKKACESFKWLTHRRFRQIARGRNLQSYTFSAIGPEVRAIGLAGCG